MEEHLRNIIVPKFEAWFMENAFAIKRFRYWIRSNFYWSPSWTNLAEDLTVYLSKTDTWPLSSNELQEYLVYALLSIKRSQGYVRVDDLDCSLFFV